MWSPLSDPRIDLSQDGYRIVPDRGLFGKLLAGFQLCRAALAYSIFHFSSPRPSTVATRIEASWAIWGESALHRIAHDTTSSS